MRKKIIELTEYEMMEQCASDMGVRVYADADFPDRLRGLYLDNNIMLNKGIITEAERGCILAEEIGHAKFTTGNILDQHVEENRKQELQARAYAYKKKITIDKIFAAAEAGCRNRYELAEYIGVPEWFLNEAPSFFRGKFGPSLTDGRSYIIYFDPLGVYQLPKIDEE